VNKSARLDLTAGRLEHVRESVAGIKQLKEFWKKIGKPVSYVAARNYHMVTGVAHRREPTLEYIQCVLDAFPEVSPDWLVSGKGEVTRDRQVATSSPAAATTTRAVLNAHLSLREDLTERSKAVLTATTQLIEDLEDLGAPVTLHGMLLDVMWDSWDDVSVAFPPREEVLEILRKVFPGGTNAVERGAPREHIYAAFYGEAAVHYMKKILSSPAAAEVVVPMVLNDRATEPKKQRAAAKRGTPKRRSGKKGRS